MIDRHAMGSKMSDKKNGNAFWKTAPVWLCLAALVVFLGTLARPAAALETIAREALLIDADTGAVLFEKDPDVDMPPASMSKLMTIYMIFERLKEGRLSLDDTFQVSENAWRKGGARSGSSTMFLEPGKRVRVEDLIRGIIVQSGNDACIVAAEAISGTEEAFAEEMTRKARQLGMERSTFRNATGWPHPEHRMTARELAILAKSTLTEFPDFYHYYSESEFTYNGIRQHNRNPLLGKGLGADGLKTGHTKEAGYGLTATAKRGERRLILVVNGLPNRRSRRTESAKLFDWGFREFDNYALFKAGETVVDANVWLGEKATVPLVTKDPMKLTLSRKARADMKVKVNYVDPIPAPIKAGDELATVTIEAPGHDPVEMPLVAAEDVVQLGVFGRLNSAFRYIIFGGEG